MQKPCILPFPPRQLHDLPRSVPPDGVAERLAAPRTDPLPQDPCGLAGVYKISWNLGALPAFGLCLSGRIFLNGKSLPLRRYRRFPVGICMT